LNQAILLESQGLSLLKTSKKDFPIDESREVNPLFMLNNENSPMQLGAEICEVDVDNETTLISKLDLNRKASNLEWPSIEKDKLDRSKSAPVIDCPDFVYNSTGDFPDYTAMTNPNFYDNGSPFDCHDS
jgi:hypothetical protein